MSQPRPQYREDSEEDDDDDDDDDDDEDYGGRRRGIDHASRPKRAAAKQAEQQLKAASVGPWTMQNSALDGTQAPLCLQSLGWLWGSQEHLNVNTAAMLLNSEIYLR